MLEINDSRLATVLRFKQYQEKKVHEELVQLLRTKEQEQAVLLELNDKRETAMTDAVRTSKARVTELQTSRAFLRTLSREIQQKEKKVGDIQLQENDKREELVEKTQSKQMVDNLEQRRQAEMRKDLDRREQRLIDVLAQRVRLEF